VNPDTIAFANNRALNQSVGAEHLRDIRRRYLRVFEAHHGRSRDHAQAVNA
jgi:hypothetical protein